MAAGELDRRWDGSVLRRRDMPVTGNDHLPGRLQPARRRTQRGASGRPPLSEPPRGGCGGGPRPEVGSRQVYPVWRARRFYIMWSEYPFPRGGKEGRALVTTAYSPNFSGLSSGRWSPATWSA